ncbi:B12-binding domain-containing radical SAM protein [Methylicorpusculum oleiharenae]|uniref:B12-binding domain-containing radical SAM protein n=1 Tax=Methylicorpusculum oleiharenae TaxID=1338687 RepID=UPI00135938E5|nr:radical SAM protein [Methylicorpusculum oleiharenae]MCD2448921.1 B12-binding domain-containing radical SAM protein [Methylicorpusculum oleiharenae]
MNILIANPAFRRPLSDGLERYMLGSGMRFPLTLLKQSTERPRYVTFPFFLAYTAALLEREGFNISVIDGVPLNLSENEFLQGALETKPAVILLEPNTAVIVDALRFSYQLKEQTGAKIVVAGSHASVFASELLKQHSHIDFILIGEYELACLNLTKALREGVPLANVAGLAYRANDGRVLVNPQAPLIDPLDQLPPPARHLFPRNSEPAITAYYDGMFQHTPTASMHTSRGCPYRCNFCVWIQVLYRGEPQRYFSAPRIVDEMQLLINKFDVKEIYFDDDNFTSNRKHVRQLCAEIKRRHLNIAWSAMGDAIALNDEMLECMADAGCVGLKFGLDSADSEILDAIKKPLKVHRLEKLIDKAGKLGIKTHMSVVFGLTNETRETMEATFEYACELDIDSVQFSMATPCPGTDFYNELAAEGRIRSFRWEEYDGSNMSVINYPDFSCEYLERFTTDAHTSWLRRKFRKPGWLWRQAHYLVRLTRGQGWSGLSKRFWRAIQLLTGDSVIISKTDVARVMRR